MNLHNLVIDYSLTNNREIRYMCNYHNHACFMGVKSLSGVSFSIEVKLDMVCAFKYCARLEKWEVGAAIITTPN